MTAPEDPQTRSPARRIPLAKPAFDENTQRLVCETLRSGWVAQGPRVLEFERAVAEYVGVEEAVAVTSGTSALFLALHCLGLRPGDEVIVPSLSFIATANCIVHCGATPVFVDVDPKTFNIDPGLIEAAVTQRTRAILPVDQLGLPADLERINAIAKRHDLFVVEDAACALGSLYKGQPVGGGADLACFSFHPRKLITTGEGGMITTHDQELAKRLRLLRHQGMNVSDLDRHRADEVIIEQYPVVGYNFRLSDLQAAVGLAQLVRLDEFVRRRRELAALYQEKSADVDEIETPRVPADVEWNYQSYIVRLCGASARMRNAVLNELLKRGVSARRGLMAIHREPCYAGAQVGGSLVHTEVGTDQTIVLPMHPQLSDEDVVYVVDQLRQALAAVRHGRAASKEGGSR